MPAKTVPPKSKTRKPARAGGCRRPSSCSAVRYRLLQYGDPIRKGCESLQYDAETWEPVSSCWYASRWNPTVFMPMREPNDSALVEVAANAMQTKVRDAHVIRINEGPWLDFEATHQMGKSLGFGGYLNLLEWLVEKYGAPFKGVVHWPNDQLCQP